MSFRDKGLALSIQTYVEQFVGAFNARSFPIDVVIEGGVHVVTDVFTNASVEGFLDPSTTEYGAVRLQTITVFGGGSGAGPLLLEGATSQALYAVLPANGMAGLGGQVLLEAVTVQLIGATANWRVTLTYDPIVQPTIN